MLKQRKHKHRTKQIRIPTVIQIRNWKKIWETHDIEEIRKKGLQILKKAIPQFKWEIPSPDKIYVTKEGYFTPPELFCQDDMALHYVGLRNGKLLVAHFCLDSGTIFVGERGCTF